MGETHYYRWRKYLPTLYGQRCRIIARGAFNARKVEFEDGTKHIVSGWAIRKVK
jgi:hypothetical protein